MPGEMSQSSNGPPEPQVILTCVYCGHAYPPGTPAAMHPLLTEHIAQCDKHPVKAVVQDRDRLLVKARAADKLADEVAGIFGMRTAAQAAWENKTWIYCDYDTHEQEIQRVYAAVKEFLMSK